MEMTGRFTKLVLMAALLGSTAFAGPVFAQTAPAPAEAPQVKHSEVFIAMRDGVKLAANVYLPDGPGPWPVVLTRTPYLKDGRMFGEDSERWTKAGYAYVVQDVRGKGHSEGFYDAFNNDIEDGYDTVEGLAKQPWSNGKIGVMGASAMGITSNLAAIADPPHLKAAFVIVAPNETFNTSFLGGVPKDKDNTEWLRDQKVAQSVIDEDQGRIERSVFHDRQGPGDELKYVRIPTYNVGGWYDIFNTGSVYNFVYLQNHGANGARGNQKLFMGPFGHGDLSGNLAYPNMDSLRGVMSGDNGQDIRWFNYWLKGIDNGIMDEPPVQFFMMASAEKGAYSPKNKLMSAGDWPLAYRAMHYYLAPDLGLTTKAPTASEAKSAYRFDPANPVKTFGGANLTFERGPSVDLYAATDGPDTDFEAKLVDVYPDGYEALVLDAPIRARYRHGRLPDDVQMMTPGAPEKLTIDLWNTALTFEKGHRIALHITSSNAPRFEVNANTGEPTGQHTMKPRVAVNTVYYDKDHPSALVLPIVYLDQK